MEFLMANPILIVGLGLLVLLMISSSRMRKKLEAQQAERENMMRDQLKPGVWVMTASGFWGRYVDTDGDTVILENADGTETYWKSQAIAEVGGSPFPEEDIEESAVTDEAEETVLGLTDPESSKPLDD